VNNRDLKTFSVDVERSIRLSRRLPSDRLLIAESGIDRVETIRYMKEAGFHGFLMGEHFMKEQEPAIAFASFVKQLNKV
jgi:indole-3-glycerol phosphate synthase